MPKYKIEINPIIEILGRPGVYPSSMTNEQISKMECDPYINHWEWIVYERTFLGNAMSSDPANAEPIYKNREIFRRTSGGSKWMAKYDAREFLKWYEANKEDPMSVEIEI